jgi:hypothetical protein
VSVSVAERWDGVFFLWRVVGWGGIVRRGGGGAVVGEGYEN